ncbi:MAG: SpoIIE family protein phosphatase [Bacteroidales bacterium]|nr:SpoIIE family protein phosphatase [Bacteroidales bacterium]
MKKLFAILFVTLLLFNGLSQSPRIKFDKLSLEDGLSQSNVYSITQDYRGFMWFGTLDGLNKYNGYEITIYRNDPENPHTVSDNYINFVFEDSQKNLLIGTKSGGLNLYNRFMDNFSRIDLDKNNKTLNSINFICAAETKTGEIWFGTDNGIFIYVFQKEDIKKGEFKKIKSDSFNKLNNLIINQLLFHNGNVYAASENGIFVINCENKTAKPLYYENEKQERVNCILIHNNTIWYGTDNGLKSYNLNTGETTIHNRLEKELIINEKITSIANDGTDNLWIGSLGNGVFRYIIDSKTFHVYKNDPTNFNSLSVDNVLTLYFDKSDILWIGTSLGGVNKTYKATEGWVLYKNNPFDPHSINVNQIRCFFEDSNGDLWVGTVEGGLNRWDLKENKFYHYSNEPNNPKSISHNHVRDIMQSKDGTLWIATDGGGLNRFDKKTNDFTHFKHSDSLKKSISGNRVWSLEEDSNGNIWVGTFGDGLNIFNPVTEEFTVIKNESNKTNSLSDNNITYLFFENETTLWIGTFGGGLNMLNISNMEFTIYKNSSNSSSISNNRIYSIIKTKAGQIWVGTKGGLNKLDPKTGKFKSYSEDNGMANDVVMGILEDNNEFLWLSTNKGIIKFDSKIETFRNYDMKDGLQSNEFLVNSFLKTKNGMLLFGGIGGFNAFYPENIKDNPHVPKIAFTRFQIFNKDVELDTSISEKKFIELSYSDKVFSFEFVAMNYFFPDKNQYKYKLEGFDKDWNHIGNRRFITYTNVPHGTYVLKVMGSNNDGIWNETPAIIIIKITPPFWKTTWFYLLVAGSIILLIVLFIKYRERKLKKEKQILEKKVLERTIEVRTQKEEIEAQRDEIQSKKDVLQQQNEEILQAKEEIEAQRDEIQLQNEVLAKQKEHIEEINKEMTDSIHYAKRIQAAILPSNEFISKNLKEYFVLFRPKDIVSGDFYWMTNVEEKIVIAVADCTGHGVPGAFMSMLGAAFLNEIINKEYITHTGVILRRLRKEVIRALQQKGESLEQKDGMDICLCCIDSKTLKLQFSGANNPLYIIRNSLIQPPNISEEKYKSLEINNFVLYEIRADKMPIAIYEKMDKFETQEIQLEKDDLLFMFSDGFADQFGGPEKERGGKKFMYKSFKKLLLQNANLSMVEQKNQLIKAFEDWIRFPDINGKSYDQVDDIVVLGLKI